MRLRLTAWVVLVLMFLAASYLNALTSIIHPGRYSTEDIQFYWGAEILGFIAIALATAFQPRLRHIALLVASPLALALLGKALYFCWLGYRAVFANDILFLSMSCFALYFTLAFQVSTWGFRLAHIAYATLWLFLGLLPVAYAFAYETKIDL